MTEDNPYDPEKEGAKLALQKASRCLGHEAEQLAQEDDFCDVTVQDVSSWIENWKRALDNYRRFFPVEGRPKR